MRSLLFAVVAPFVATAALSQVQTQTQTAPAMPASAPPARPAPAAAAPVVPAVPGKPAAPTTLRGRVVDAADSCEAGVIDELQQRRGRDVQDVQFVGGPRFSDSQGGDDTMVRGEGRYRIGARSVRFTYGCAYNRRTGDASGVVLREVGGTAPAAAAVAEKPFQPDLSRLSPAECDSAAAAAIKRKHPRAAQVALDAQTRQLRPGANNRIVLEGRGAMQPAPGMLSVPITYRCEIEPRSGEVVAVQTNGG
jgi:hypothetical protein